MLEVSVEKWWTVKEICNRLKANLPTTIGGNTITKATVKLKGNSNISAWTDYTADTSKWSSDSTYGT